MKETFYFEDFLYVFLFSHNNPGLRAAQKLIPGKRLLQMNIQALPTAGCQTCL